MPLGRKEKEKMKFALSFKRFKNYIMTIDSKTCIDLMKYLFTITAKVNMKIQLNIIWKATRRDVLDNIFDSFPLSKLLNKF